MGTLSSSTPPSQQSLSTIRPIRSLFSFLLLLFLLTIPATASFTEREAPEISYFQHCNDVVPESSSSHTPLTDPIKISLSNAHYSYASRNSETSSTGYDRSPSLFFRTKRVYKTQEDHVFKLDGNVHLRGFRKLGHSGNSTRRGLRLVHYRPPRIPVDSLGYGMRFMDFSLSGFWNSTSGKLCMVGGNKRISSIYAVIKLDYPDYSTVSTSLVNGTLEILNADGNVVMDALNILGLNLRNYEYKFIENEIEKNVFQAFDNLSKVSVGFESGQSVCVEIRRVGQFDLEYKTNCESVNCDFLGGGRKNLTLPSNMAFNEIQCLETGEVRYLLGFRDGAYNGMRLTFEPNTTLITEGKWDREHKRLDMVGCRILDGENKHTDCSVRMILRWPVVLTMQQRSAIVGEMWSDRSSNESGYFGRVTFRSNVKRVPMLSGVRYEYTQIENVTRSCARKMTPQGKGGKYPDVTSRDMSFDMIVKNRKGEVLGSSSLLFVGEKFHSQDGLFGGGLDSASQANHSQSGLVNVSYELSFRPPPGLNLSINLPSFSSVRISAEGVYDSSSGHLCMIGCMSVDLPNVKSGRSSSPDCEVLVDVQYPPLNAKARSHLKGTIESTRNKSDPLYFEPFKIVSHYLYANQAKESIWRMDLEITMVLISNTLACIFVGLQLYYVKKHPNVLPCISIVMLTVLTLAHMIPLLLNFEALFLSNHYRQNAYIGSDGWLEADEVLVRIITMVVFLLEFRLLQLTWSAKVNDESQKILWISEKKVLYLCLPLYLAGFLAAWFSFLSSKSHGRALLMRFIGERVASPVHGRRSFWGGLKSYAGLILDGFLFPQILFNLFCDDKERALAPSFYVGTTFVRLLPHAYDLYRAHSAAVTSINYIFANPRMDYYSTTWDIVICGGGLLFVILIWSQQRFGGRCFLPKRFRQSSAYEKVPVVSGE